MISFICLDSGVHYTYFPATQFPQILRKVDAAHGNDQLAHHGGLLAGLIRHSHTRNLDVRSRNST